MADETKPLPYQTKTALLESNEAFYTEVKARNNAGMKTTPSSLLRDYVKIGLQPDRRIEAQELERLRDEVENLRRELAPVGGNLNQLAYMFNTGEDGIVETQLGATHQSLIVAFKKIIDQFQSIEDALR